MEKSNKGKNIGKEIHQVIQEYIENGSAKVETNYPLEVTTALNSFIKFKKANPDIMLIRSEIPLTSEKYKFNGTIDCIGTFNNETIIFDWKTAEAKEEEKPEIYDQYLYQVSTYVNLFNENNNEKIDKAIIVSIAKDKEAFNICHLNKKEIEFYFQEIFLPLLKIYHAQKKGKK